MKYTKLVAIILLIFLGPAYALAQTKVPSAEVIVRDAMIKAAATHKNVFIIFHASWCSWCRKMDNSMNDEKLKSFFDNNYIIVHVTVDESQDKKDLENPGATELRKKYHGEGQGLPFWFILDAKGNFLADARLNVGNPGVKETSVGCPATNEEINYFLKVLQKTSSLNTMQLAQIQERFLKNKE